MPLRTEAQGVISAAKAAQMSAAIATSASATVMHSQPDWLPALYCMAFEREMRDLFRKKHKNLGERVSVK